MCCYSFVVANVIMSRTDTKLPASIATLETCLTVFSLAMYVSQTTKIFYKVLLLVMLYFNIKYILFLFFKISIFEPN